jgi:hypothetical protein
VIESFSGQEALPSLGEKLELERIDPSKNPDLPATKDKMLSIHEKKVEFSISEPAQVIVSPVAEGVLEGGRVSKERRDKRNIFLDPDPDLSSSFFLLQNFRSNQSEEDRGELKKEVKDFGKKQVLMASSSKEKMTAKVTPKVTKPKKSVKTKVRKMKTKRSPVRFVSRPKKKERRDSDRYDVPQVRLSKDRFRGERVVFQEPFGFGGLAFPSMSGVSDDGGLFSGLDRLEDALKVESEDRGGVGLASLAICFGVIVVLSIPLLSYFLRKKVYEKETDTLRNYAQDALYKMRVENGIKEMESTYKGLVQDLETKAKQQSREIEAKGSDFKKMMEGLDKRLKELDSLISSRQEEVEKRKRMDLITKEISPERRSLYAKVYRMSDQGLSVGQIAKETKSGKGEIELILGLRNENGSNKGRKKKLS